MQNPSFLKDCSGTIWPIDGRIREVHAFPKAIRLKVNVIAQIEIELTNSDSTGQRFNHYITGTPPISILKNVLDAKSKEEEKLTKLVEK